VHARTASKPTLKPPVLTQIRPSPLVPTLICPKSGPKERVLVRDGHIAEAQYKEPFDGLFSEPKFEYGDFDLYPKKWTTYRTIWP
jgi:hypothetical protein